MVQRPRALPLAAASACLGLWAADTWPAKLFVLGPAGGLPQGNGELRLAESRAPKAAAPSAPASLPCLGAAAGAALLGAALGRRARVSRPPPRSRVATRDGSSWGSIEYGASTSVDNSGPLPIIKLKRGEDEAIVYPFGACVTSYKTGGVEWLAVRPDAKLDGSKAISGGLPICFPQFGPGDLPQHGFARDSNWRVLEEPSEAGVCVLELTESEATLKIWPHAFRCELRVELMDDRLSTTMKVMNTSASDLSFTAALHSYYNVFHLPACEIKGDFVGSPRIDKTADPPAMAKATSNSIKISKFTEEIYKEVLPGTVTLTDPTKGDLDIVSSGGWRDVVVWNPFGDEAMGADGFVCVESAELAPVPLPPKGVWEAKMDLVPKKKA